MSAQTQTIFDTPPQTIMDLGQPKQNAIGFPLTLAERYQPRKIEDFIGLKRPKRFLSQLMKQPKPCAGLFVGPPGAGKTAISMAFSEQMPATLVHVGAQKCDVAKLDELNDRFAYMPPIGGWWHCLIDEADQMTEKAQLQLLSRLDGTASLKPTFGGGCVRGDVPPVIWTFTCNGRGKDQTDPPPSLLPRFVSRCMMIPFEAVTTEDIAEYLKKLWEIEHGEEVPEGWFDFMAEGVGVRDALMRLDVDLMAGPRPIYRPPPSEAVTVAKSSAGTSTGRAAALKSWATRRAKAAQALLEAEQSDKRKGKR